ncbi:MAG TPA: hemerythrin domain-containing protein, partial [Caulobacteraceae bacterium]|nr:hemerythrin domain-containing protein [Caulobacteraceae bacterium]
MPAKGGNENVIELLKQDHRDVERLFEQFEKAENENEKMAIAERICLMLQVHTQLEEELFYPAIRGKIEDDMVDEAVVEHGSAKQLMEQIQAAEAGDEMFEAQVKVLQEQIEHHVEEEEQEMFPEVEKSGV